MAENDWSNAEKIVKGLVEDLTGVLKWTWDGRFGAALSQFTPDNKDRILVLLKPHLASLYDSSNIGEAPPRVYEICGQYGGLRSGQLLFSTNADQDILLLGAWWPWGDGKTISIRIIPSTKNLSDSDKQEFTEQFKGWFGV